MAKKEVERGALSLRPDAQEQGGLLDDVDATLSELRFVMWDYDGEREEESPFLRVTLQAEGDEYIEHYSAGASDRVEPSKDGLKLFPKGESQSKGLKKSTKAAMFLRSIVEGGFDPDEITDSVDCFENCRVHLARKPYTGYGSKEGSTILLVSKVLPAEKGKGGKSSGGGKGGGKVDLAAKADATIEQLLEANDGKIAKSKLSTLVFKALKKDPDVKAVTELVLDDEYLEGDDRPFDYDGDTVIAK